MVLAFDIMSVQEMKQQHRKDIERKKRRNEVITFCIMLKNSKNKVLISGIFITLLLNTNLECYENQETEV